MQLNSPNRVGIPPVRNPFFTFAFQIRNSLAGKAHQKACAFVCNCAKDIRSEHPRSGGEFLKTNVMMKWSVLAFSLALSACGGGSKSSSTSGSSGSGTTGRSSSGSTGHGSSGSIGTSSASNGSTSGTTGASSGSVGSTSSTGGSSGSTGTHAIAIAVSPATATVAMGVPQQFHAVQVMSDGTVSDVSTTVTWTSASPTIATVDATGLVTPVAAGGPIAITATQGTLSGSAQFTVSSAVLQRIAVTAASVSVPLGTTDQLTATGQYSDGTVQDVSQQVSWTSSSLAVATVSAQGLVTPVARGTVTFTATSSNPALTGSIQLAVTDATLTGLTVNPAAPVLAAGYTIQLSANGTYSDGSSHDVSSLATWTTSAASIATVNGGLISGVSAGGPVTITVAYGGRTSTATFSVSAATLVSIAVLPSTAGGTTLALGTSGQLKAMGTFSDHSSRDLTTQLSWTSDVPAKVAVSNNPAGQLQALAVGISTVHATDSASGVAGSVDVTVTGAALRSITVTASSGSVPSGTAIRFTATGHYSDQSTQDLTSAVTWTSAATNIVISNSAGSQGVATTNGTATGVTVTATDAATAIKGSINVDVTAASLSRLDVSPALSTLAKGTGAQLKATGTFTDGSQLDLTESVTWVSSSPSTVSVQNTSPGRGAVTALVVGSATITATDSSSQLSSTVTVNVSAAVLVQIAILQDGTTVPKGTRELATAQGTFSDGTVQDVSSACTWVSSNTAAVTFPSATVHNALLAVDIGDSTLTATDPTTQVAGSGVLHVSGAVLQSLAITPANAAIAKGESQVFVATGTYSDGSQLDLSTAVTWTSSDLNVANFPDGTQPSTAHGNAQGSVTITATDASGITATAALAVGQPKLSSLAFSPNGWNFGPTRFISGGFVQGQILGTYTDGSQVDFTTRFSPSDFVWTDPSQAFTGVGDWSLNTGNDNVYFHGVNHGRTTSATASVTFTDAVSGIAGSASFTVDPAEMTSITITPQNVGLTQGGTTQLTAHGLGSDGNEYDVTKEVSWTSSDITVATVGDDATAGTKGLATGVASSGSSTITATTVGQANYGVQTASTVATICGFANAAVADGVCGWPTAVEGWDFQSFCNQGDRQMHPAYLGQGYHSGFTWTDGLPATPIKVVLHMDFSGYNEPGQSFSVTLNGQPAGTFTLPNQSYCNSQNIVDYDLTPYLASYTVGGANGLRITRGGYNWYGIKTFPNSSLFAIVEPTY
jgi:uncharacterized protein YjdB